VAHLQAQLALATSEITRLRETFAMAAASTSTSYGAAPGPLLMAALLPCSSSPQADKTLSAELNPTATPDQEAPACIKSRQPQSPTSCEHSLPLLLL
jgi:hypothetical protein